MNTKNIKAIVTEKLRQEQARVAYLILWMLGAPVSLLLVLWVIFGSNLIGKG